MEALYLLIPISTALVFLAIWVFVRASDSGQFDDMVGPALRILRDDDSVAPAVEVNLDASHKAIRRE
jgi:cbb3-type cytochrome oxidase maturation protein